MPQGTKIATCCYCGTRAALVLRGKERHELTCSACGAPLHDMKMLRSEVVAESPVRKGKARSKKRDKVHATPLPVWEQKAAGKKKKKKRKPLAKRFFEEAFDVIEDIFD